MARLRGYVLYNKYTHTHTLGGKRGKRRQERVDSVAANSDNRENRKEAGGGHKVPRA